MILYSRPGCHLCDMLLQDLRVMDGLPDWQINIVNVDDDPALSRQYGLRIPVLLSATDGQVISEGRFDKESLEHYLAQKS